MIRRIYFILIFFWLFSIVACGTLTKFKTGDEAFERKHYSTAIELYQKELSHVKSKKTAAHKLFLIAEAYRKMDLPQKSVKWYKKSIEAGAKIKVYYSFAKVLKKIEKYDEALKVLLKAEKKFGRSPLLNKEISVCKQSIRWKENANKSISLKLLDINSQFSDFASDFYLGDYLAFSSDRLNSSKEIYAWTGNYYYDIFITDVDGLTEIIPLRGDVNTTYNDASACFNSAGTEMFFVRCGDGEGEIRNCKLYHSIKFGDEWTQVKLLPFVKDNINYISPRLSADDRILFFSSDDPNGYGGYDIYFAVREEDGWSKPALLPKTINTIGNEKFITTWKNELYFSSDFLAGLGGYDIYKTEFDSTGKLSPPEHLEYPLNSGGDDFYLLKNSDSTGILSSSRINGKGLDDIYSFVIKSVKDTISTNPGKTNIEKDNIEKKVYLALKVVELIYLEDENPNSRVLGKKPVQDAIVSFAEENKKYKTPGNGVIIREVAFDSTYNISIGKKGYLTNSKRVHVNSKTDYDDEINTINLTVSLDKIYFGKEIVLKNIYYDYDKWTLRDESIPTLNELYLILKNNPGYKIKIGSHTDCRGEEEYNQILSQKRAASVVDYLIGKGISKDRLESVGYGKTNLIEKCNCEDCTEQQHQKNRRTTFEILK